MINLFLILWGLVAFLYLALPCALSGERRQRWWLRLTLCRWNVTHLVTVSDETTATSTRRRRLEVSLAKDEEDKIRKDYIRQVMGPFSMSLKPSMIVVNLDSQQDDANGKGTIDDSKVGDCEAQTGEPTPSNTVEDDVEDLKAAVAITTENEKANKNIGVDLSEIELEGTICGLPMPGEAHRNGNDDSSNENQLLDSNDDDDNNNLTLCREVTNSCAICLSSFEADETLCWSSNPSCQHVFHSHCLQSWLSAMASKQFHKRLKKGDFVPPRTQTGNAQRRKEEQLEYLMQQVTRFTMPCPCCRQVFLVTEYDEELAQKEEVEQQHDVELGSSSNNNNNNQNGTVMNEQQEAQDDVNTTTTSVVSQEESHETSPYLEDSGDVENQVAARLPATTIVGTA
mmetsp:Transcript_1400/g.3061  ORF Transcript_1400/g.3061 Transcript_1400/m.3061 type:complete len:398 (+) Transcript_1400:297-1490(+)